MAADAGAQLGQGAGEGQNLPRAACCLLSPLLCSFVVGSDGYVYEGRGWHWVGAHTRGHNSRGFGVAIVGNYTAGLPTEAALRTLHDLLPRCAVRAGLLKPDYALLGHRQLVHTDCPGDALFNLLRTWPRFATVSPVILTTSACLLHKLDAGPDPCLSDQRGQASDPLL